MRRFAVTIAPQHKKLPFGTGEGDKPNYGRFGDRNN